MFQPAFRTGLAATALLLALPSTSHAQVRFGTLLGASVAKISDINPAGDNVIGGAIKSKSRAGFQVGGYLMLPLAGGIALQPEVHYMQKGTKLEVKVADPSDPLEGDFDIKLGYVEIPVLLRADLGSGGLHPFIVAGPSFAIRTSCVLGVETEGFKSETKCDDGDGGSESDPFKKTDVGGIVGVGLTTSLVGRSLSAQFRYGRGFTSLAKNTDDELDTNAKPRNSGFSIVFGIGF